MATEKRLISVNDWDTFFNEHIYNRCFRNDYEQGYTDALDRVDDWMDDHPTVDAIEVIRCHDCQYSEPRKPYNKVWCPKMGRYMKEDGFCSEGERKDND